MCLPQPYNQKTAYSNQKLEEICASATEEWIMRNRPAEEVALAEPSLTDVHITDTEVRLNQLRARGHMLKSWSHRKRAQLLQRSTLHHISIPTFLQLSCTQRRVTFRNLQPPRAARWYILIPQPLSAKAKSALHKRFPRTHGRCRYAQRAKMSSCRRNRDWNGTTSTSYSW